MAAASAGWPAWPWLGVNWGAIHWEGLQCLQWKGFVQRRGVRKEVAQILLQGSRRADSSASGGSLLRGRAPGLLLGTS